VVGGGQSLSLDTTSNRLIITGLASAAGPHVVLTADLGSSSSTHTRTSNTSTSASTSNNAPLSGLNACGLGPLTTLGTFPYSGKLPVAHSSELDAGGTTLYVNLATDVRCAFCDRNLHSRMPLVPAPARLKLLHARDQCRSSRVATFLPVGTVNSVQTLKGCAGFMAQC
jgi:hypothetical protein